MKTNRFKHMTVAAAIFGLGAIAAQQAQAAPLTVNINGGGVGLFCVDQTACDTSTLLGFINWTVGALALTGTGYLQAAVTAQSYPALGTPANPILRLNITLDSDASGTSNTTALTIRSTQTGFTPSGLSLFDLGSTVNFPFNADSSPSNATAVSTYFLDNSDTAFGTSAPLGGNTFTFTSAAVSAQAFNQTVPGSPDGSFSLTEQVVFNGVDAGRGLTASAVVGVNQQNQVPEPASMALVGVAMLGLGITRLRRRKQG